jgi:ATP-dependent DNA helicase RecG
MIVREPYVNEEVNILKLNENQFHDFKSKEVKPAKLQPHFVAFANSDGGELYIGIEDVKTSGERISGFEKQEDANNLIKVLLEETSPSIENVDVEFIDFLSKGLVLHINIPKSPKVHYTSDGKCFVRLNARTSELKGEKVTQLSHSKGIFSYENMLVENIELDNIVRSTYLKDYIKRINSSLGEVEFLKKQNLVIKKNEVLYPSVSCILLFHDEPQACLVTKCAIKIYRLNTCDKEYKRDYLVESPRNIEGPIEIQLVRALECIDSLLNSYPNIVDGKYVKFKYPYSALKELVVNAIIHRDYSLNDDIHIKIFNDRIEIQSPGVLPGYITEGNIFEEHFSRNPKIVRLISKLPDKINYDIGEGLSTVFEEVKIAGLARPEIRSNSNSVLVTINNKSLNAIDDFAIKQLEAPSEDIHNINIFDNSRNIVGNSYSFSKKLVSISAFFPEYPDINGSCLISFARIKDCLITFNHEEILNTLFTGLYTEVSLNLRGFIVGKGLYDENIYYVQLGNNRIPLFIEELVELCEIIDDLSYYYLKCLSEIEDKLGTYYFDKSSYRKNGYRLININRNIWRLIIEFISEHDYENGDSPWHIFDASEGMIKVYTKKQEKRYNSGYHVLLYPEAKENEYYGSFKYPDQEMSIIWEPMQELVGQNTLENFNLRRFWNAEVTHNWIIEELIPQVIYYFSNINRKKRLFTRFKELSFDEFISKFKISNYARSKKVREYINLESIRTIEQLLFLTENMQSFFNGRGMNKLFLLKNEISPLYLAIMLCLKHTPLDNYEYIIGNLRFDRCGAISDLFESLDNYTRSIQDGIISSFTIDTALRCLVVPLRDYKSYLNEEQIITICEYLKPLYKKQMLLESIERFQSKGTYE